MILGVDHLALSCADIDQGIRALETIGYHHKFLEKNLPNRAAKQSVVGTYTPTHAVAFSQREGSIALELTEHACSLAEERSSYRVFVATPPADAVLSSSDSSPSVGLAWRAALECPEPTAFEWPLFGAEVWSDRQGSCDVSGRYVQSVLVPTADLDEAERFWISGLRFSREDRGITASGHRWSRLLFPSVVPAWSLRLIVLEDQTQVRRGFLDDKGFPCIALISNRLSDDLRRVMAEGGTEATDTFALTVHKRDLEVVIVRGPGHELVELFSVQRT